MSTICSIHGTSTTSNQLLRESPLNHLQTPSLEEQKFCCHANPTFEGQPSLTPRKPHFLRNKYLVVLHTQPSRNNPLQCPANLISRGTYTLLSCIINCQGTTPFKVLQTPSPEEQKSCCHAKPTIKEQPPSILDVISRSQRTCLRGCVFP